MITINSIKHGEYTDLVTISFSFAGDEITFTDGKLLLTNKEYQISSKQGAVSLIKGVMARELHHLVNRNYV